MSERRRRPERGWLLWVLTAGCAQDAPAPDRLFVTLDGDPSVLAALGELRASLYASHARTGDAPLNEHTFRLQTGTSDAGPVTAPFSFAVERSEPRVALVVTGHAKDALTGPPAIEAKAILTFSGRPTAVDIYLSDRCYGLVSACDALDRTCHADARACGPVPEVVPRPVEPGDELTGHLAATPPPPDEGAPRCPPDHTCRVRDYPCEPTTGGGYVCLGQRADWPMPGAGTKVPPRYDHASTTGVVYDLITGLIWQRHVPAFYESCSGHLSREGDTCNWNEAKLYCSSLTLAGRRWRLPSKIELESILEETAGNPPIDRFAFPATPGRSFWTSSPSNDSLADPSVPRHAWSVLFDNSAGLDTVMELRNTMFVRCVSGLPSRPGTPSERYAVDERADTVQDRYAQLTWARTPSGHLPSREAASAYCASLPGAFRLPSFKELLTNIDPAPPGTALPDVFGKPMADHALAWSSSPHFRSDYGTYIVDEQSGVSHSDGFLAIQRSKRDLGLPLPMLYARCVR